MWWVSVAPDRHLLGNGCVNMNWNRRRVSKYGNLKVEIDGYKFDSKAEARRYGELKLMGVKDLVIHPRFPIMINGKKVCDVVLDFHYRVNGKYYFEDIKGKDNALSRLKRKLVEAYYPEINVTVLK